MKIVAVCDEIIKLILAMCPEEKYIVDVTQPNQGRSSVNSVARASASCSN